MPSEQKFWFLMSSAWQVSLTELMHASGVGSAWMIAVVHSTRPKPWLLLKPPCPCKVDVLMAATLSCLGCFMYRSSTVILIDAALSSMARKGTVVKTQLYLIAMWALWSLGS